VGLKAGVLVALLTLLGAACGGDGKGSPLSAPAAVATQTPVPYVPEEEPTPSGPQGRVTTQVTATCRLSTVDAEISANYKASVVGPNSNLRRVRLLLNNKLADDSGDIFAKDYEANVKLHVSSGTNYSLIVTYIVTNAIGPQILNVVRCPMSPGPGA
jgi:hypothetical protein